MVLFGSLLEALLPEPLKYQKKLSGDYFLSDSTFFRTPN